MVIDHHIASDGHQFRLSIEDAGFGWNVREEFDSKTIRLRHYDDWHRAERAMQMLELEIVNTHPATSASNV